MIVNQVDCRAKNHFLSQQALIFGDMSNRPIQDISILLDDVYYPILKNPKNQEGWPDVIKKDVDAHVQGLRNTIAEVSFEKCAKRISAQHAKLLLNGLRLKVLDQ